MGKNKEFNRDLSMKEPIYRVKKVQKRFFGKEPYTKAENSNETNPFLMHNNSNIAEITWDSIYNSLSIMLLILDEKGRSVNCNSAFRKYIKQPKKKIIGNFLLEILYGKGNHPHNNVINTTEITKKRQSEEIKVKNKWLKISADPVLNRKKKIKNIIIVLKDITESKNNIFELELREKKFKDIVELSNIAIETEDIEGNLIYFNNQFSELFGYTETEIKNITHRELIHPEDLQMVTGIHDNRVNGQKQPSRYEYRGIKKNKDIIYIDISVINIIEENGKIIGTRSYLRDITERKKFILDLESALDRAKESDRLKSSFLGNISHEIRTPLNGIMGFSKLLERKGITDTESKSYGKIINSCSNQLFTIMRDILDISKIETGQIEINKKTFNLNDIIELIYLRFQPQFKLKGIEYILTINPSELNVELNTDIGKLDQILSNLLNNALKFTHKGSVELSCFVKADCVEFYVKDTGIGVDKSMQGKIFDRFRQAELVISKKYDGNGLGLSICKGLVKLLGGQIGVESEKGQGSTFYFTIPFN
ncbi:MAG: ATP-binding protein [Bacteroidales bacterium]|jgi:PAS domain S-box-containing protein|nr:ATP-binding protein [Bacteroidales bacterium]